MWLKGNMFLKKWFKGNMFKRKYGLKVIWLTENIPSQQVHSIQSENLGGSKFSMESRKTHLLF